MNNNYKCLLCGKKLDEGGTKYSVCYDPLWATNLWGGDSHEYVGYLCDKCGQKLEKKSMKEELDKI